MAAHLLANESIFNFARPIETCRVGGAAAAIGLMLNLRPAFRKWVLPSTGTCRSCLHSAALGGTHNSAVRSLLDAKSRKPFGFRERNRSPSTAGE